jgi:hypothetical protein
MGQTFSIEFIFPRRERVRPVGRWAAGRTVTRATAGSEKKTMQATTKRRSTAMWLVTSGAVAMTAPRWAEDIAEAAAAAVVAQP